MHQIFLEVEISFDALPRMDMLVVEAVPVRGVDAEHLEQSLVELPAERSAPAQNARPAPVTITVRTPSSASAREKASISSPRMARVKALSFPGRLSVTVAMPSSTS